MRIWTGSVGGLVAGAAIPRWMAMAQLKPSRADLKASMKPSAHGLDLVAAVLREAVSDDLVVFAEEGHPGGVAQPFVGGGGVDDVAEEQRDGAVGGGLMGEVWDVRFGRRRRWSRWR